MSNYDFAGEFQEFADNIKQAQEGFKSAAAAFLEEKGEEFLGNVQEAVQNKGNVDTGKLKASFAKGADDNIWQATDSGNKLVLEVGSDVLYASFIDTGHWTSPQGQSGRWVPGYWSDNKFVYDPQAKTGMYLKQQWVEGSHYFSETEDKMQKSLDKDCETFIDEYFKNLFGGE